MRRRLEGGLRAYLRSRARRLEGEEKDFQAFVSRVRRLFKGEVSIALFGSRALGNPLPYSDYDVALVIPKKPKGEAYWRLLAKVRGCKPRSLPLDLVILQPNELSDPLLAKMLEKALPVYDGLKVFRVGLKPEKV